jgi:hypothetical protein
VEILFHERIIRRVFMKGRSLPIANRAEVRERPCCVRRKRNDG